LFHYLPGAPATNNPVESYFSKSLKTDSKKQFRIYIPTPPLIFSLNFVDLVILALVDGDYFLQIIKNSRFLLPFQSKNL